MTTTQDAIAELRLALYGYRVSKNMAASSNPRLARTFTKAVSRDRAWVRRAIGELRAATNQVCNSIGE